ncbi:MAG: hypothetical protein ACXVZV_07255 [Terriglobales bacterium]
MKISKNRAILWPESETEDEEIALHNALSFRLRRHLCMRIFFGQTTNSRRQTLCSIHLPYRNVWLVAIGRVCQTIALAVKL